MRVFLMLLSLIVATGLSGCSKFKTYNGPEVTEVFVFKETRKMYLMHHNKALKEYDIDLGFAPEGHKEQKGDGRTPEGTYYVDRRNPNSSYHLSLGINYPNDTDRESAKEAGVNPGGDIFIHGGPRAASEKGRRDWTAGCIAVKDKEIEDIYAMVRDGTPIHIVPVSTPKPADGAVLTDGVVVATGEVAEDGTVVEAALSEDELALVDEVMAARDDDSQIVVLEPAD